MFNDDKFLFRFCISTTIIGVIILLFLSQSILPKPILISSITKTGTPVIITGEVTSLYVKNNHVFFYLKDETGKIKIVFFESTAQKNSEIYSIKNSEHISVTGKVDKYKGELEVIGEKITF